MAFNDDNPVVNPAATQNTDTSSHILNYAKTAMGGFIGGFCTSLSLSYFDVMPMQPLHRGLASLPAATIGMYDVSGGIGWISGYCLGMMASSTLINRNQRAPIHSAGFFGQNNQLCYADADLQNNNYCPNPSFNIACQKSFVTPYQY